MISMVATLVGVATTAIATEHFFTVFLSSLPTTQEFFSRDGEKQRQVKKSLNLATGSSLAFALYISYLTKKPHPLVTAALLTAFFWHFYMQAIEGKF